MLVVALPGRLLVAPPAVRLGLRGGGRNLICTQFSERLITPMCECTIRCSIAGRNLGQMEDSLTLWEESHTVKAAAQPPRHVLASFHCW